MPNPITSKTIRKVFTALIKDKELSPDDKIALFVANIPATINNILKTEIEWCLFDLNAQANRANKANTNNKTGSELFEIYFPNLKIQDNVEGEVSRTEEDDAIDRTENRLATPIIKNDKEEREEATLAYNQAMSDQGPLHQILIELGMTQKDFDNDFHFKNLIKEMYTSQTFFYKNHPRWIEKLEYFSERNLGVNNINIIFILYASELTLAKHPNKRELMLQLYLSIVTSSIRKSQNDVTFYTDSCTREKKILLGLNSIFKDDYPDIYNASTKIFNDIISDKRFKDIITLHIKIITFHQIYYPTFYVRDIDDTELHPLTLIHRSLTYIVFILSFANILPMIPAIVALGLFMLMINTFFHYRIYSIFKKDFSIFDNTGQTTKTFITNLILSSLLIITTTSVFVSLVLNSYPMIALLTCAFCMIMSFNTVSDLLIIATTSVFVSLVLNSYPMIALLTCAYCMLLSFNTVSYFTNSYKKTSMSIIKNHKDEIKQDTSEYTKLIDDFIKNPNPSSSSKTSDDLRPAIQANNNLAPVPVEDLSLFGSAEQTGGSLTSNSSSFVSNQ